MAKMFFVIFVTVSLCFQSRLGDAFNMSISPNKVNGLMPHNDVSITCRLDKTDTRVKEVVVMDLYRAGQAIAINRCISEVTVADGLDAKFRAEGNISKSVNECFLHVTMSNPELKDTGLYTCLVYYLDTSGRMREMNASANLTVTEHDVKSTLVYLVGKVSTLETKLSREKDEARAKETQILLLQGQVLNQMKSQEKRLQREIQSLMETQTKDLVGKVSALKTELSREKDEARANVLSLTNQMKSQEKRLQQEIQSLVETQTKGNQTVMFTAVYGKPNVKINKEEVIVFGHVITNQGQGYDGTTGIFTAPVAGYYLFHLSVFITSGQNYLYADLKSNNGQILKSVFVGDKDDWRSYADGSCVVKLEVGEQVKPMATRHVSAGAKFILMNNGATDRMNTFSGYLLKAV